MSDTSRNQTFSLRVAITHAEREISLLREYRTRLIADVVTGKFDVREVAARLPDEAEEPEAFKDSYGEGLPVDDEIAGAEPDVAATMLEGDD